MTETPTAPRPLSRPAPQPSAALAVVDAQVIEEYDESGVATVNSGWGGAAKVQAASSSFANVLKFADNQLVVVKVLDEQPFDTYAAHWLDDMPEGQSKSVRCWGSKACPLCRTGDKLAKFASCFNVVALEPSAPVGKIWEATRMAFEQLKKIAEDPRRGPIDRPDLYFAVTKNVKGKRTEYEVLPVKARDLQAEYDIAPLDDERLGDFMEARVFDATCKILDGKAMAEIVNALY